jgi:catechol 2,3-dioxygenase-like lactoylglutathione lyase family enzyme
VISFGERGAEEQAATDCPEKGEDESHPSFEPSGAGNRASNRAGREREADALAGFDEQVHAAGKANGGRLRCRLAEAALDVAVARSEVKLAALPARRVVIDHVSIGVSDLARSRDFYRRALAPLGFEELGSWSEEAREVAFGPKGLDDFGISTRYPAGSVHIAFAADSEEQVRKFYAEALRAGGRDNGPPGPRPEYSAGYYGAFVLDPDGNNIEAVFHAPAGSEQHPPH